MSSEMPSATAPPVANSTQSASESSSPALVPAQPVQSAPFSSRLPVLPSPIPSPTLQTSRPPSPSPHGSITGRRSDSHMRRPSSSLSSSSRRASLLTPPDSGPQRFPRPPPSHQDAQAFVELHQELEAEQEAQVNRLLHLIRQQQQASNSNDETSSTAATVDSASTTMGRPRSPMSASTMSRRGSNRLSRDNAHRPRSLSRGSHASSPSYAATGDSASESSTWLGSSHSEVGYYAAETQMLKRENEMLKRRIRELEKQVADLNMKTSSSTTATATTPTSEIVADQTDSKDDTISMTSDGQSRT